MAGLYWPGWQQHKTGIFFHNCVSDISLSNGMVDSPEQRQMAGCLAGDGDVAILDIKPVTDLRADWAFKPKRLYQYYADLDGVD